MASLRRNAGAPQEWLMRNELLKGRLSYRWSKTKDPHMSEYLNAIFMELENSWGTFWWFAEIHMIRCGVLWK